MDCYQCGKCTSICPMRRVSRTSPRRSIYDSNVYSLGSDAIWTCLTCGLCPQGCPQNVDFLKFIREERQGKTPLEVAHHGVFTEFAGLSSKLDSDKKEDDNSSDSKYGFFPGCVDSLDLFLHDVGTEFGEVTSSSMKLLEKLDIKPKMMDMKCCGHDVIWQGRKDIFERLKEYNKKYIKESGIDTLITSCAECYRTFSKDYGLGIKVVHTSQLLDKLDLKIDEEVTYHDPCRLGRHMGEYDAPRRALTSNGVRIREMEHSRENSLCCGVSNFMNCNEKTKALRIARMDEAEAMGVKTLITTCTKCLAHFNCLKNEKEPVKQYDFNVVDLNVFLAKHLEDR